ncbi:MAG: glycosyltransferase [Chlamydiales bacterium]|nr:glycosyltransferase [Chlamydiales bacterium]
MTYRILRICAAYPYINSFEEAYRQKKGHLLTYGEVLQSFQQEGLVIPGGWAKCMKELQWQAEDIIPDFTILQWHWAKEQGIALTPQEPFFSEQIFLKQVEHFKPDVIFFERGGILTISQALRRTLKDRFPFLCAVVGLWGDDLQVGWEWHGFNDLDILFGTYTSRVECIRQAGISSDLMPLCFDHNLACKMIAKQEKPIFDFVFAGTSGYRFDDHQERYEMLCALMQATPLHLWCSEKRFERDSKWVESVLAFLHFIGKRMDESTLQRIDKWISKSEKLSCTINHMIRIKKGLAPKDPLYWRKNKPLGNLFPSRVTPALFGTRYYQLLGQSKIVFNRHRDDKSEFGNIRMFEVTGMGSCLLTDRGWESRGLFELDQEIVAYSSVEECIEKANYLLENEPVRSRIAHAGHIRTLKEHTVFHRCEQLAHALTNYLKGNHVCF